MTFVEFNNQQQETFMTQLSSGMVIIQPQAPRLPVQMPKLPLTLVMPPQIEQRPLVVHNDDGLYIPSMSLEQIQKHWIISALEFYPTKKAVCAALGCTMKTLYNKMHEYGVFDKYKCHWS